MKRYVAHRAPSSIRFGSADAKPVRCQPETAVPIRRGSEGQSTHEARRTGSRRAAGNDRRRNSCGYCSRLTARDPTGIERHGLPDPFWNVSGLMCRRIITPATELRCCDRLTFAGTEHAQLRLAGPGSGASSLSLARPTHTLLVGAPVGGVSTETRRHHREFSHCF